MNFLLAKRYWSTYNTGKKDKSFNMHNAFMIVCVVVGYRLVVRSFIYRGAHGSSERDFHFPFYYSRFIFNRAAFLLAMHELQFLQKHLLYVVCNGD